MTCTAEVSWEQRLRAGRDTAFWATNTRLILREAHELRGRDLQATIRRLVFWCEESARRPDVIDADVFVEFIEELSRVAGNYGRLNDADVDDAIDKMIELQRASGRPTTRLWLAKARFHSMASLEGADREGFIEAAIASADAGTELWAEALLAQAWYLIDISRYSEALRVLDRLSGGLPREEFDGKYRCGFHVMSGVALFTSFRSIPRAAWHLERACEYEGQQRNDQQIIRWLATAHHYLGRIAELEQDHERALRLYIHGQTVQERGPEELQASGFIHLRMSEPLIALGLLDAAKTHLEVALQKFSDSAEHSSGRLQAHLGFATYSAVQGDVDVALKIVEEARSQARAIGFWRGELLCLGYRFSALLRARRYSSAIGNVLDILTTLRGGELGRNNVIQLVVKMPALLGVVTRRMAYGPAGNRFERSLSNCPCPLHAANGVDGRESV